MTLQREIGKKAKRAARLIPDREKGETMHINEIVCQTCAGAGLPQRHSWSQTKRYGILVCGICQHQTDIRKHHALKKGRNKWFRKVTVLGKTALRCNIDGKWVLSELDRGESGGALSRQVRVPLAQVRRDPSGIYAGENVTSRMKGGL